MIKDIVDYLNTKLNTLGYFDSILCLAEKIEKEDKQYPAIYTNNEYVPINLDDVSSTTYWRKNGDVSFSPQNNETGVGIQYVGTIPLKLVFFKRKEAKFNDQYFTDNICLAIISTLTVNNAALNPMLNAKKVRVTANKYTTDRKQIANDEYDGINFEPQYQYAYGSIEFDLTFVTNSQCYKNICS